MTLKGSAWGADMKFPSLLVLFAISLLLQLVVSETFASEKDRKVGVVSKPFDQAFIKTVAAMNDYKEIVKLLGVEGKRVGTSYYNNPGDKYHWEGAGNSTFNVRVVAGKIIDANVTDHEGRVYYTDKLPGIPNEVREIR